MPGEMLTRIVINCTTGEQSEESFNELTVQPDPYYAPESSVDRLLRILRERGMLTENEESEINAPLQSG